MRIRLNEQDIEVAEGTTIGDLLRNRGIATDHVAVERNGEIGGSDVLDVPVADGDAIIVVRFVGGG